MLRRPKKNLKPKAIILLCRKLARRSRTMKALAEELPSLSDGAQEQLLHVLQDADAARTRFLRKEVGVGGPPDRDGPPPRGK
jgi:hypothetical protein